MNKQNRTNLKNALNAVIENCRANHGTRAVVRVSADHYKRMGYRGYFVQNSYGYDDNLWLRHDVERGLVDRIVNKASLDLAELRNKLRYGIDHPDYVKGEIAQLKSDVEDQLKNAGIFGILKLGHLTADGIHVTVRGSLDGTNSGYGLAVIVA